VEPRDGEQAALAELHRQGDWHATFSLLVKAYGVPLQRYCRRQLKDDEAAEDVYQTVLIQAYRDLPGLSCSTLFRNWLFTIAHNRCMDALKSSRSRDRYLEMRAELPEARAHDATPEEQLMARVQLRLLEAGVKRLSPPARRAIILRYCQQLSYEEMAEICQEPPARLRVRVARARAQLRQFMRSHDLEQ
jgi:RNA polymerase sigma factor (sigma-70 family)